VPPDSSAAASPSPFPLPGVAAPGRRFAAVLLAAALLLLAFLGSRELCNPDEPRDAETAREYAEGMWDVVPEINGVPFLERPPLFYAMVATSIDALGPTDLAARLVPALLGVLTIAATFLLGESLLGKGRGWLPALLLLGTPYFALKTRCCLTDVGLAAFTTASLALFFEAHRRDSRILAAAAGAAAGLAFLCKGLLGFGIPAVAAGAWLAWRRDLGAFRRLRLWIPILVGVGMVLPWVWALHRVRGAEGLRAYFVHHHIGRLGEKADHAQPFWFYVRALWVLLPLTPLLIAGAARRAASAAPDPARDAFRAGAAWVGGMLLVLSAIGGKRVVYLLPLLPGAALGAAAAIEAAAAGTLGRAADRVVRGTVRAMEGATLQFVARGSPDLRVRAGRAALGLAVLAIAFDAAVLVRSNGGGSGRDLSARAVALAAGRRLVLFQVGEGDIGQFTYALRTRLPVAWNEAALRAKAGPGTAVVLAEKRILERAIARGTLSADAVRRLVPIEEGIAGGDHVFVLLAWDGTRDPATGGPRGGR
jgi:4-amino-4-deoxy-L-arabinose transferase-like glycosyltransferase